MKRFLAIFSVVLPTAFTFANIVSSPEEFFYQKGYQEGYAKGKKEGFIEGYKRALQDIKAILNLYKKDLQALEVGKYLSEEQKITYPRIVKIQNPDGSFEIKVIGCRFENLRSLDDIPNLEVPIVSATEVQKYKEAKEDLVSIPKLSQEVKSAYNNPPKPIIVKVDKKYKNLLEKLNIPYEINDKGEIKAIFFKQKDYENFLKVLQSLKR